MPIRIVHILLSLHYTNLFTLPYASRQLGYFGVYELLHFETALGTLYKSSFLEDALGTVSKVLQYDCYWQCLPQSLFDNLAVD